MQALAFWKTVTADRAAFLERLLDVLAGAGVRYCVVGGQAVNAYVEPVVRQRQKDLADISRLLEAHPELRPRVPAEVLARIL